MGELLRDQERLLSVSEKLWAVCVLLESVWLAVQGKSVRVCACLCVLPSERVASSPVRTNSIENLFVCECRSTNKHLHMQKFYSTRRFFVDTSKHQGIINNIVKFRILKTSRSQRGKHKKE